MLGWIQEMKNDLCSDLPLAFSSKVKKKKQKTLG